MIDIGYYRKIQNMGNSNDIRTSQKYEIQLALNEDFNNTLDSHTVEINGVSQELTIIKTANFKIKKIKARPNETFYTGDIVFWNNLYWLITITDDDDTILRQGKMEQCNYVMKWQNENGEIIERHSCVYSTSKYNDGTNENAVISLGSDQLGVAMPIDSETIKLKKYMGKKFFIDNNKENPTTYELTNTGNIPDTYNGHGITSWILKECAYSPTPEDLQYGVCNYISPTTPPEEDDETTILSNNITGTISGNINLKVGFSRAYTANLADENGNTIEWSDDFYWNIVGNIDVGLTESNGTAILLIDNEDSVDERFKLTLCYGDKILDEIVITIISPF